MMLFKHASGSRDLGACFSYAASVLLALFLGVIIGVIMQRSHLSSSIPLVITEEDISEVPVVVLNGIRDNKVTGEMQGDVRLIIGNTVAVPDGSGSFAVQEDDFLVNRITVNVPPGARFVASKRGKKYYPIGSASAEALTPQNRIYFETAEQAEQAGYSK